MHTAVVQQYSTREQRPHHTRVSSSLPSPFLSFPPSVYLAHSTLFIKENGKRFAVKCVKRADLPPDDEADLKMEVRLLQEVSERAREGGGERELHGCQAKRNQRRRQARPSTT